MRLNDQPAVLEWAEFPMITTRHEKLNPTQRRMECATLMEATRHFAELPPTVRPLAVIRTMDGITLHPADI
jgi:hypothetical protein